jgi:hypothetical protein
VKIGDPLREVSRAHQSRGERLLSHTVDHGGEGLPGEAFDQSEAAGIGVDEARGDPHLAETGVAQQRVERAANEGIVTRFGLQRDQARDRVLRKPARRGEEGRTVIAFDWSSSRCVSLTSYPCT